MTIKSQIVLVLALSAVGNAFAVTRPLDVCQRVASSKDYAGVWAVPAEGAGDIGREAQERRIVFAIGDDGHGVVCDRDRVSQLRWSVKEDGRIRIDERENSNAPEWYEFEYRPDVDALEICGGGSRERGLKAFYIGASLSVRDAQVLGADIWALGQGSPTDNCACYGGNERQMRAIDEIPDLAKMLDAGNGFFIRPEGCPKVDLRSNAIVTNLLDGAILARESEKGWSEERTDAVLKDLQAMGIACEKRADEECLGIHFTAERSQLKSVRKKLCAWLADLPYPCKCIEGETPNGWICQDVDWVARRIYRKKDLLERGRWAELSKQRSEESGRTVVLCEKMMKSKSYEGQWSNGWYTLNLTRDGEGVLYDGRRDSPLRWKADAIGHLDVELYRERDTIEKSRIDYMSGSDMMIVHDGVNGIGETRNNYLMFKSATVPEEPAEEEVPDFENPISPAECERLMREGKYGIRRMDSLDDLPDLVALTKNHESWEMVDDVYPRLRLKRDAAFYDAVSIGVRSGRYSPKSRAAPIKKKYCDFGSTYSGTNKPVTVGWSQNRLEEFISKMSGCVASGDGCSEDYSGKFAYSREDGYYGYFHSPLAQEVMERLREQLLDMKFPRYYRIVKVSWDMLVGPDGKIMRNTEYKNGR